MSADCDVAEAVNDLVRLIRDRLLIQTALALPQRWCLLLKRCPAAEAWMEAPRRATPCCALSLSYPDSFHQDKGCRFSP